MICVSVAPESRTLARADLVNAAQRCDLIELCLDRLIKQPDVKEMIEGIAKPILISCRRPQDGGHYRGSEEDRQMLLRQAIIAEPAYIELDLDIANSIPRFGKTQRVISYTTLDRPLDKIDDFFEQAYKSKADVVKFTWPTPTLDAAWPLLSAVSKKRELPVVGMGIGNSNLTFSLLGQKYGSPWIYAALEPSMRNYAGQPTVHELDEIHRWRGINGRTQFVAIAGRGVAEQMTCRIFNTAFDQLRLNMRCLPMVFGGPDRVTKMFDILRIGVMMLHPTLGQQLYPIVDEPDAMAETTKSADFLVRRDAKWAGYSLLWKSALRCLEDTLGSEGKDDRPLDRRNVLVIGHHGLARTMVEGIRQRKGLVSVAGTDDKAAQKLAQQCNVRHVQFGNLYDTLADVVVFADPNLRIGNQKTDFHASFLRPSMTVMDVSSMPAESDLSGEARARGCKVVNQAEIYAQHIGSEFRSITGQSLPDEAVAEALADM